MSSVAVKCIVALCLFLLSSSHSAAAAITGGETIYRVVDGDSLQIISAKSGVDSEAITSPHPAAPARAGTEA